ncbi:1-aminocyclopropane-1-carboxylate oxidase [Cyphellophora attinorum]|uniref:1-aminocyclopropane-1-carboxylate oxidase n=1 Tax=Cyphellophora attinorum TaxID=1664694 RepID=A0A0N1P1H2_9EURO|nr:1-aminocyclopropane-1-carboxylate oxidase [Phialophora attinorum]KPI42096.1 1-aminocyclopropane-1-carboxylate oxidase [Phialophora attinorum]
MAEASVLSEGGGLPVLDFSAWREGRTQADRVQVAKTLVDVCRRVGFVYITNHGLPAELVEEAFGWTHKLFALDQDKKMLAPHPDGAKVHRGYSWPGLEKVSQQASEKEDPELASLLRQTTDHKESYEIGSEENTEQPNVWLPEDVLPGFRSFTTRFYWECNGVANSILSAIALGLGLDEDFLLRFHSGHNNQLRLLHYPPVEAASVASAAVARMPAHTDWGSVTMLFQDDCGGLEVENPHKPGQFITATPIKNALVMNVGDLLMRWSNDDLKSTLHRVTLPPDQDRYTGPHRMTRDRYSIPFFVSPDSHSIIECLPACTDANRPIKYAPVLQSAYRISRANTQYQSRATTVTTVTAVAA